MMLTAIVPLSLAVLGIFGSVAGLSALRLMGLIMIYISVLALAVLSLEVLDSQKYRYGMSVKTQIMYGASALLTFELIGVVFAVIPILGLGFAGIGSYAITSPTDTLIITINIFVFGLAGGFIYLYKNPAMFNGHSAVQTKITSFSKK